MKPIYFPFTYLSQPVLNALGTFFRQIIVYQPLTETVPEKMQTWAQNGQIDIRVPVSADARKLQTALKECRSWGNLHQTSERTLYKFRGDTVPYINETNPSQIRENIKKGLQETESGLKPDPLFYARLFLLMAQDYDIQIEEVRNDFLLHEKMTRDFFQNLTGEITANHMIHDRSDREDPTNYMIPERLDAWGCLMRQDPEFSGLFITISRDALQFLTEKPPKAVKIAHFEAIPIGSCLSGEKKTWVDNLRTYLENLAENPFPQTIENLVQAPEHDGNDTVSLTIYAIPEVTPLELFARLGKRPSSCTGQKVRFKNTLLGCVDI